MRLDRALPRWDRRERHRIPVDAPASIVLRAARELTWREVPVFRGLMLVRFLRPSRLPADGRVMEWFTTAGFTELDHTEDEIVVGAIPGKQVLALEDFREFSEPRNIKIAFNFRYAGGELTTETRVLGTDRRSTLIFGAYWIVIRAGSGLIRRVWLRAVRRRAEHGYSAIEK